MVEDLLDEKFGNGRTASGEPIDELGGIPLPRTGSDAIRLVTIGLLLVAGGFVLVLARRARPPADVVGGRVYRNARVACPGRDSASV